VAGLQAIATARRLGAKVEVTDVRPETKEQVESLGAKFITVEGLDQVSVQGGYVAAISEDVLARQKEAVEKSLLNADLVICTALVTGGKAPTLITADQVGRMKRGAVIIDMAAEAGGNCELTKADERVVHNGVLVMGPTDLASSAALNASELYAKNVLAFLTHIAKPDGLSFDTDDEITSATLVVHNGQVRL
jgi:NAD(P) transhydrogenase subunit alpha